MKKYLFVLLMLLIAAASQAFADDTVKIAGKACEIYSSATSKSSIRVKVTDKASYNAVSQIPSLLELKSQMLEHDFNVIVYNLVDNYVQNMSVKTVDQSDDELCVEVTGYIPAEDINMVVANYSPSNPAPEYDFAKANNVVEEDNTPFVEDKPTMAEVMYNGPSDFDKTPEPTAAPIAYQPENENTDITSAADVPSVDETPVADENKPDDIPVVAENTEPEVETPTEHGEYTPDITLEETQKSLVYVAPVEFSNNTHSSKPIDVIKNLFDNGEVYTILDHPDGADYTISSKVLKAKIDQINSQTRRLQMVVSAELKIKGADGSIADHQNRFVLFNSDENEQEVAMNLLRKLLFKSGKKLYARVEQNEQKRRGREFLMPAKTFENP